MASSDWGPYLPVILRLWSSGLLLHRLVSDRWTAEVHSVSAEEDVCYSAAGVVCSGTL